MCSSALLRYPIFLTTLALFLDFDILHHPIPMARTPDSDLPLTKNPTMACTPDSDLPLTEDPTTARTPDSDLPLTENPTTARTPDSDLPLTENPTTACTSDSDPAANHSLPGPSRQYLGLTSEPYEKRALYSSEIIEHWNIHDVVRELGTREGCVNFCEQHNLVATERKCRTHKTNMKLCMTTNNNLGSWVCHKKSCRTASRIPRTKGTFFENIKIDFIHVFYLIYAYAHCWSYDQIQHEDPLKRLKGTCLSRATIADWFNYCREVVVLYTLEKQEFLGKIGGPGKIVQIDESKFGKRKYNRGRHIEGHWVLGMIEDGSEDLRLEVCPDNIRSADVLVPLIQKHIEVGTILHTDCWRAYNSLSEHGYTHKKVNHSDPDSPFVALDGTHTQRIESQWRAVKRSFRKENYNNSEILPTLSLSIYGEEKQQNIKKINSLI